MANLTITAANVRTLQATNVQKLEYGATIAVGDLLYLDSDGSWKLADGNSSFLTAGSGGLAFALVPGVDGDYGYGVTEGPFFPGATTVEGKLYIPSDTAGKIAEVDDQTTGWWGSLVGIGQESNGFYFSPKTIDEVRP